MNPHSIEYYSKVGYRMLMRGTHRVLLGRSFYSRFSDDTLEFMNYAHSSPEGRIPYEKQYLYKLALEKLPTSDAILEIGVFSGRSTNALAYIKRTLGKGNPIITTDPWLVCDDAPIASGISSGMYRDFIKRQFMSNLNFWCRKDELPYAFDYDSNAFFEAWKEKRSCRSLFGQELKLGGAISFALIDGDHSYIQAKADFVNVDTFLVPHGFIYFDDSDELHLDGGKIQNGVFRVVQEALGTGRYRVACANPNYLLEKICCLSRFSGSPAIPTEGG